MVSAPSPLRCSSQSRTTILALTQPSTDAPAAVFEYLEAFGVGCSMTRRTGPYLMHAAKAAMIRYVHGIFHAGLHGVFQTVLSAMGKLGNPPAVVSFPTPTLSQPWLHFRRPGLLSSLFQEGLSATSGLPTPWSSHPVRRTLFPSLGGDYRLQLFSQLPPVFPAMLLAFCLSSSIGLASDSFPNPPTELPASEKLSRARATPSRRLWIPDSVPDVRSRQPSAPAAKTSSESGFPEPLGSLPPRLHRRLGPSALCHPNSIVGSAPRPRLPLPRPPTAFVP